MALETVMLIISGVMVLGSIVWTVWDVRRRNKPHRERIQALLDEARQIIEKKEEK